MNRMLRPLFAAGLIAGSAVAAAGCAANDSTLFIYGVLHSKAPQCTAVANPGEEMLGSGLLDVSIRSNYEAWLLVGNQYAPRGAKQQLKTETTRVTLTGAEITLKNAGSDQVITCPTQKNCGEFSVFGSGFADSARGEEPGWGAIAAQLIPNSVGEAFRAQLGERGPGTVSLVATVRVFGSTLGGQDVESGGFSFPIQICNGCLIDYAATGVTSGVCEKLKADVVPVTACRLGQDETVDCRSCLSTLSCLCPPGSKAGACSQAP